MIAISMVGTASNASMRYSAASSMTMPGSNASTSTCVMRFDTAPSTQQTQPPV